MKSSKGERATTIVAIVSGKGGTGKTLVGLSTAFLLSQMNFTVLFVDFDLATNGASYFFKDKLKQPENIGIWDIMKSRQTEDKKPPQTKLDKLIVKLPEGFDFIASRAKFDARPLDIRQVKTDSEVAILSQILTDREMLKRYDYVVIDCQAGYSTPCDVAISYSNKLVLVSELDNISNDAAEMLLAQAGNKFPEFRRFLLNKLTENEMEQYKLGGPIFRALNRLPALPHDFEARALFGAGKIPVDMNNASSFLFAMFRMLKELFPEELERIEQVEQSQISGLTKEYEDNIEKLADHRAQLTHQLDLISEREEKMRRRLITVVMIIFTCLFATFALIPGFPYIEDFALRILFTVLAAVSVVVGYYYYFRSRQRAISARERTELQRELDNVNKQISDFKSLVYSRSKEFRVQFPSTRGVYYKCKICGEKHKSPIAFDDEKSFKSSTLASNRFQCPKTGELASYDKEDMFWKE
jgi:cellulose biosynthesis protein BcsQ